MCYSSLDPRTSLLLRWLTDDLGLQILDITPASSDASFRRYFRVNLVDGSKVVMDAPPEKETTDPFIKIAALLKNAGLHVPYIYQQNQAQGFLLLEDLGNVSYLDRLNIENAEALYAAAMDSLFNLQSRVVIENCQLPHYDQVLLNRELGIFYEWFLEKLLGIVLPVSIRQAVDAFLIDSALQQPRVCVHRDYHSRNLMYLDDRSPGVIDFQDAVIGPITYDLVSLLRDCYIRWPEKLVQEWLAQYHQRLIQADLLVVDLAQFKRWFDLMGLQRHLKAVGIFSRLHLRDNKSTYLADIPLTMGYIVDVCEAYPELQSLSYFLQQQVLPVYRSYL